MVDIISARRYTDGEVMALTLQDIMREKNLTKYSLSKKFGIPWATLSDICSGKTNMRRCSAGTLMKLSQALGISMEELLAIPVGAQRDNKGKPVDRSYLGVDLPESIQKAIRDYLQGEQENSAYLDCFWDELYGAINSNLHGDRITEEQAAYLRNKYLFADTEDEI
jgi:plasmid maintenance system antidote protein VapI